MDSHKGSQRETRNIYTRGEQSGQDRHWHRKRKSENNGSWHWTTITPGTMLGTSAFFSLLRCNVGCPEITPHVLRAISERAGGRVQKGVWLHNYPPASTLKYWWQAVTARSRGGSRQAGARPKHMLLSSPPFLPTVSSIHSLFPSPPLPPPAPHFPNGVRVNNWAFLQWNIDNRRVCHLHLSAPLCLLWCHGPINHKWRWSVASHQLTPHPQPPTSYPPFHWTGSKYHHRHVLVP